MVPRADVMTAACLVAKITIYQPPNSLSIKENRKCCASPRLELCCEYIKSQPIN